MSLYYRPPVRVQKKPAGISDRQFYNGLKILSVVTVWCLYQSYRFFIG